MYHYAVMRHEELLRESSNELGISKWLAALAQFVAQLMTMIR